MKNWIIIFIFASTFIFCSENNQTVNPVEEIQETEMPDTTVTISYLALGDSYTIGESVSTSKRWPVQLRDSLLNSGFDTVNVEIIARTGWTTGELLSAIESRNPEGPYELVSLLIGVNNQFRSYEFSIYAQEFEVLLKKAITFAGNDTSRVIVLSIPDYGVTPFGQNRDPEKIAREIDRYNQYAHTLCETYDVAYFDITPISRLADSDNSLLASDGLHPSGKMYTQWVQQILPHIRNIFEHTKQK